MLCMVAALASTLCPSLRTGHVQHMPPGHRLSLENIKPKDYGHVLVNVRELPLERNKAMVNMGWSVMSTWINSAAWHR